jgi:hypothetical protein
LRVRRVFPEVTIGQVFGEWEVKSETTRGKDRKRRWNCLCRKCGREYIVSESNMVMGRSSRCRKCWGAEMGILQTKPDTAFNDVYRNYERSAAKRGLLFAISKDEFKTLTQQNCHYCGTPPQLTTFSRGGFTQYTYNGIDRKDNDLGYIISNALPCCFQCNTWKRTVGYDEFLTAIKRIAENLKLLEVSV